MTNDKYTYYAENIRINKLNNFFSINTIFFCLIIIGLTSIISFADSKRLSKIQQAIEREGLDWTAGENWVSRLSPQLRKKLIMESFSPPVLAKSDITTLPQAGNLPSNLDWRKMSHNDYQGNYVTSVKDQGQCGSCWAFSAVGQIESWWLADNNRPDTTLDLSEQTLVSSYGSCEEGGSIINAFNLAQRVGIPPEWCLEYRADDTIPLDSACADWQNYAYTIPGWNYITGSEADINNIKNALLYHPVSASYEVYSDFKYYKDGVYEPSETSTSDGDSWHAILIVGWNDADSCWICKNSWGSNWGETMDFEPVVFGAGNGGYFRIKWDVCHIGEYSPFIWNEVGGGNYLSVQEDDVHITLTQGNSAEKSITLANSGPDDIDFAAFSYSASIKFHVDDFNSNDGTSWWCGDPALGGYDNHWLQYLQTPPLNLSSTQNAALTWKGFWSVENPAGTDPPWDGWDGCNVWISTDGGKNYNVIEPEFPAYNCQHLWSFGHSDEGWDMGTNIAGWGGSSNGWTDVEFDLSAYNFEGVILRWAFASDLAYCTEDESSLYGYFVDDIIVSDGNTVIFENHGEDNGEMVIDGYSGETADWLSINNGVGTVPAGSHFSVDLSIDTKDLEPGDYEGSVVFTVSDTLQKRIRIPVILTVEKKETGIADNSENQHPSTIQLYDNYPNPFNPNTMISYYLPQRSFVEIKIYDMRGRKIRSLIKETQNSGQKCITWNGRDDSNEAVSSGMYIYSLQIEGNMLFKKMLLIR
ncbi:MAG: C1 family peptidase [bacterium]